MKKKLALVTIMFALLATLILGFVSLPAASAEGATVWTDKPDYTPGETVTIFGSGFLANSTITVGVIRPDSTVNSWSATSDAAGDFTTTYQLNGILGTYTVTATDGTNTATTTFTDADIDYVSVSPATRTITAGDTTTYTVTVAKKGGSTLSVTLSILNSLPSDYLVSFSPNPVLFSSSESGSKTSTLTIVTPASGSTGTFNFKVRGTKTGTGDVSDSSYVSLVVQAPAPTFSVTFDATTSPGLPGDVADDTEVLTVTIGSGSPTSVTKAELPKVFSGIASDTSVSFEYKSPLASTTTGKRYRWLSTSGTGSASGQTGQSGSFSLTSTSSVTATYKTQYLLTVQTNGLPNPYTTSVSVGGTPTTDDFGVSTINDISTDGWRKWFDASPSSTGTIGVDSPVAGGMGTQYVFKDWSDASTSNPHASLMLTEPLTLTVNYKTQYQVSFHQTGLDSDAGSNTVLTVGSTTYVFGDFPVDDTWVDKDTTFTWESTVSGGSGKQFVKTGESGLASPITASGTSTATYKTQYLVTFDQTGLDGTATGTVLTIDSVTKAKGDLPYTDWFDSTITYDFSDPVSSSVSGKRFSLTDVTGTFAPDGTVTGNYHTEYHVTFDQTGLTDATGTVVTIGGSAKTKGDLPLTDWFDSGTTYSYEDVVASLTAGKRFKLIDVTGPTSPIGESGTVSGNYKTQYQVTFKATGLDADANGLVLKLDTDGDGAYDTDLYRASLVGDGFSFWVDATTQTVKYEYQSPVSSSAAGKQYRWDSTSSSGTTPAVSGSSGTFTVAEAASVTGSYVTQWQVTFKQTGSGVAPKVTYHIDSGSDVQDTVEFSVWVDSGHQITYSYESPVAGAAGTQYVLIDTSPASPQTVNSAFDVTGTYKTQYLLTVQTNGLSSASYPTNVKLDGSTVGTAYDGSAYTKWFDKDDPSGTIGVDATVSGGTGIQFVFTKWDEDSSTDNPRASVNMDGPKTFTADYKTRYLLTIATNGLPSSSYPTNVYLDDSSVGSAYDGSAFTKWFDKDAWTGTIGVDDTVSGDPGVQYVFTKWVEDDSMANPRATVQMTGPQTFTANYKTQYEITVTADPSGAVGGSFKVTYTKCGTTYTGVSETTPWTDWADAGTDVTVSDPQYTIPSTMYKFDHYDPSNTVTMNGPRTITLVYIELPYSAVTTSSLCPFDTDKNPANGQQFNLLFTRDITDLTKYKLTASNPGQFYYNAFYIGTPGETVIIELIIPEPFVTQGAVPIHVYSEVTVSPSGCFTPGTEIFSVALPPGTDDTISFSIQVPDTGLVYVTIHLDFGWKKQTGYNVGTNNLADNTISAYDIPNLSPYIFKYEVGGVEQPESPTISNINIFKNDPGFYGVVTVNGEPVAGATITIRDSAGKIIGKATTDENGYYFYYYKYTGKEATFTVTLTSTATGTRSQTVTLKSNKFAWAPFEL